MHNIIFVSTIHKEIGECNADELCNIIEKLNPEVIFLEAVDETYSAYENYLFSTYGEYHKKLELSAIQKFSHTHSFEYVPVCENYLSEAFRQKNRIVCKNNNIQKLIYNFNFFAATYGFGFLNSLESINLQEEIRMLESRILNGSNLDTIVKQEIEDYENPMIQNIYSYCKNHQFNTAIFMCGAAHRKSIIEKIEKFKIQEEIILSWTVFEN